MASRKLAIKLVRHGQSLANVDAFDPQKYGDFRTPLSPLGVAQAREAGQRLGRDFVAGALVYASPYQRTRETLEGLLEGAGVDRSAPFGIYEDPRLREQDHGYGDVKQQEALRATHGWFYYRYEGGESPADCYDRVSGFLESMMRQVERKDASKVLIVTHGMAIRCFVMRFLHLSVDDFERIDNPANGAIVTVAGREELEEFYLQNEGWRVAGLGGRTPG
ncbi:MAG TPA: histidine phosphatase family protein [Polyangiaceae bacterium]